MRSIEPGISRFRVRALRAPERHYTCGRPQILDLHAVAILDHLGDPPPMTMGVVALIAENADRA